MLMGDLVRALQDGGINARHWHIRHLIAAGAVKPPQRDSSGRFQFTAEDYSRIRGRLEAQGVMARPTSSQWQAEAAGTT
jgi:hypothetical protein